MILDFIAFLGLLVSGAISFIAGLWGYVYLVFYEFAKEQDERKAHQANLITAAAFVILGMTFFISSIALLCG